MIREARALGVHRLRTETVAGTVRYPAQAYQAAGFELVLHISAKEPVPHTAAEVAAFKADLAKTLDGSHPELIAIQNERTRPDSTAARCRTTWRS